MFKNILEKLASMTEPGRSVGSSVEWALHHAILAGSHDTALLLWVEQGMIRACYDLGLIVALPPPQEGEVMVHADLARSILHVVTRHQISEFRACGGCGCTVGKDAAKFQYPNGSAPETTTHVPITIWKAVALCPDCAATAAPPWRRLACADAAGPEWVK